MARPKNRTAAPVGTGSGGIGWKIILSVRDNNFKSYHKSIPDTTKDEPDREYTAELRWRRVDMDMMTNMVGSMVQMLSTFNSNGACDPVPTGQPIARARAPPRAYRKRLVTKININLQKK